jgi:hypothetical protein
VLSLDSTFGDDVDGIRRQHVVDFLMEEDGRF